MRLSAVYFKEAVQIARRMESYILITDAPSGNEHTEVSYDAATGVVSVIRTNKYGAFTTYVHVSNCKSWHPLEVTNEQSGSEEASKRASKKAGSLSA